MTSKELIVLANLQKNKDNWLTGSNISELVSQQTLGSLKLSTIEIRAIIQNLRAMGKPIIACEKGYKYTTSIKEIKEYCAVRRIEINKELAVLGSMELKAQELTDKVGQ